jgi:hypothetical protein
MSLQERIEAKKREFQKTAPKEKQEVMGRAVKALIESGAADRALGAGDAAPDFTLKNAEGRSVNLQALLEQRPVVLGFYRGRW